ncbi:MAG: flagellar biosynthesis protein FlgI [Proteobacteria bacterium]|nr:flagellar biosynthesis protein FlgI [Pseudomonadota bacterium]
MRTTIGIILAIFLFGNNSYADRLKDLASVAGVRTNQLIGYGLVVGLQGTGDGSDIVFTAQSLKSMLTRLGVSVDSPLFDFDLSTKSATSLEVDNVAGVLVTAELPAFAKPGQKIDVNVSTIGKAESLRGGTLVVTPMRGVDGEVYALAQGQVTVTGVDAEAAGTQVSIGTTTAGRVPSGATVERMVESSFDKSEYIVLNIHDGDFTTTSAIVDTINDTFGEGVAEAMDGVSVMVRAPMDPNQRVSFMSMVENLDVTPGEPPAKVVVNARTGTVVISRNVRVTAAAVTHGPITVSISATNEVSQPEADSQGVTAAVQNADIEVDEPKNKMFLFQPGVDLREIVDAVNQVGATPSSLIAILEALKKSGSLRAELVVI